MKVDKVGFLLSVWSYVRVYDYDIIILLSEQY